VFNDKLVIYIEQNVRKNTQYVIFVAQKMKKMKKIVPVLVVSLLVAGTTVFWFTQSASALPTIEKIQFAVILLLAVFGFYVVLSRLRSVRRGEPAEDEYSRNILRKASSLAYYISLYLWVALLIIKDRIVMDTEVLIGTGILGMGVIWVILVIWFKVKGTDHA